jgi:threonylcarbamoyladenosine tRNA methylthiotransferase MtaB
VGSSFHIENFGCRAARADGEAMSERLVSSGLREQPPAAADVVIVNTCSVTGEADRAARAFIRRAHRLNPEARILVTGCYAQRAPEELAAIEGVAAVVGNSHKALTPQIAIRLATGSGFADPTDALTDLFPVQSLMASHSGIPTPVWVDDRFAHSFLEEAQLVPGVQTRPNLKIQEGCGNRCTFCVIPATRGHSRSLVPETVLSKVRGFVAAGGNELVLSGINLGRWGRDLQCGENSRPTFARLVRRIIEETGLPRLRLSSIEPMDWDADLICLMREFGGSRLARHAHLPLQSGSDAVLRRMHRRYRPWHYADRVAALFEAAGPDLTLGADLMVGFPGETGGEFAETRQMISDLPFGYLHLFPFSPRPGTRGWALHAESPVPPAVVEDRLAELRLLAETKVRAHRRRFLARTVDCITLQSPHGVAEKGRTAALTENFIPVELSGRFPANRLVSARVTKIAPDLVLRATCQI